MAVSPRRVMRLVRLVAQLLAGLVTVALLFPFYGRERRWRAVQRWSAGICRIVGLELSVSGEVPRPAGRPVLVVANHVSWLDIQAIHAVCPVRFVAKSEVRNWAAIGWLSARTGTLFIHRSRHRHAAQINRAIHEAFAAGDMIAVFPEGTTTDGKRLLRFHTSLLQPAVDEQALVVPLALRYVDSAGAIDLTPSYVGDRNLVQSVLAIVAAPRLRAELRFLPAIEAKGRTRRELAQFTHTAIATALKLHAAGSAPGKPCDPPAAPPTDRAPTGTRCPAPEDCARS